MAGRHLPQQGPGAVAAQPVQIGVLGLQQVAGKAEGIDAETGAVFLATPHGQKPVVVKEQVVGMEGEGMVAWIAQPQGQGVLVIQGRQVAAASRILAAAEPVAPGPGLVLLLQLGPQGRSQGTAGLCRQTGQQLQMAMGLAGAGGRTAVEEPEAAGVGGDCRHGAPVAGLQPARLGLPALGDQQQMAGLHRVLVEDQDVIGPEALHLQFRLPG